MRHARADYDRFQDPEGKIPEDEPVFLIRGQDKAAPAAIRSYALEAQRCGSTPEMVQGCLDSADEVVAWQRVNPEKVHTADL